MNEFKSEVLKSGIAVRAHEEEYIVTDLDGQEVLLTESDINRLYGIAFPEKRRAGDCCTLPEQTDVPDINVGDMPLAASGDKYAAHVREVAEEMARIHKGHLASFDDTNYETKKYWTNWYLPYARIAVRLQAEIITEWMDAYAWTLEGKSKYLIERGLIPAPATEEECKHKSVRDSGTGTKCLDCGEEF